MLSHWFADANTGTKLAEFTPAAGNWRSTMNGWGSGQHSMRLNDSNLKLSKDDIRDLTQPWRRVIVSCWNDVPKYAGLIMKRPWSPATGVLDLVHAELEVMLSRRFPYGVSTYSTGTLAVNNKSLRGLVRAVYAEGFGPKSPRWQFPVVLPPDEAGPLSRVWENYNLSTLEWMLDDLMGADGGPDVMLQPRWANNAARSLEWELKIGVPRIPGTRHEWHVGAPQAGLIDHKVIEDASSQLTGVIGVGDGSGVDIQLGFAGEMPGSEIPYIDTRRSFKNIKNGAELNAAAWGELRAFREPTIQTEFSVLSGGNPGLEALQLGHRPALEYRGDLFVPDGWQSLYLMGMSADIASSKVKLEVQPI